MNALLIPGLVAALAGLAGLALGVLHFRSLERVTALLVQGRLAGVALQIGRLAVLAVFLWLCTRGGTWPLVAGGAGLMAGRALVLQRVR